MDMVAIREAWQQAAGRKADSLRDLSRLRARVFRRDRIAAGVARDRTLATGAARCAKRKSILRINGTVEPRLRRVPGSAAQTYGQSRRPLTHRDVFCRTFRQCGSDSRRRSAHWFSANRTSSIEATEEVSFRSRREKIGGMGSACRSRQDAGSVFPHPRADPKAIPLHAPVAANLRAAFVD